MTILKILQYPDPRLKTVARLVDTIDTSIQQIIDDMFETLYAAENCAALAATQLDILNPPRITVIDLSAKKNEPMCLINAQILERKGEQFELEGCMSVMPKYIHEKVKRAQEISVKALDRTGKELHFTAQGYLAKCIQHELDHLDGKLYIDHLSSLKRERIREKIAKMNKRS